MIVKNNIPIDDAAKKMLKEEFPDDITDATFNKMTYYGQYVNSDKCIIRGLNIEASYNITNNLNLTANYAYTYARTRTGGVWKLLDRSVKNSATVTANYNQTWGRYTLNANLNGRFQSRTYFNDYEDAPGYGTINFNTTHTFKINKYLIVEPSLGIDNILDKVDNRIDYSKRRYALLSPGRELVAGLRLKF
jgi:Outer membrane receptor for ferrienterochelin and colicins